MENEQAGEVALTWADERILARIVAQERQQDEIKSLASDELDRAAALEVAVWEEAWTGVSALANEARSRTSLVLVEAADDIDEAAFDAANEANKARGEVDDETDEGAWRLLRDATGIQDDLRRQVDRLIEGVRVGQEGTLDKVERWLSDFADDLHSTLWGWLPELTNDAAIYLASLPAMLLFESFKGFLFEED